MVDPLYCVATSQQAGEGDTTGPLVDFSTETRLAPSGRHYSEQLHWFHDHWYWTGSLLEWLHDRWYWNGSMTIDTGMVP